MNDYQTRILSEDCEVMDYQDYLCQDDDNDAQIGFLEMIESMEDVYRRAPHFGPLTVQLIDSNTDDVIREYRVGN